MKSKTHILASLLLILTCSHLLAGGTVSHDCEIDHFKVTEDVLIKDPPRFGTNIPWVYHFKPWNPNRFLNIWNENFSFEPFDIRHEINVNNDTFTKSTETEFQWHWRRGQPGISSYGRYPSGIYDGGTLEIYRADGDEYKRIHKSKVTKWFADRAAKPEKDEKGVPTFDEGTVTWETPIPKEYGTIKKGDLLVFTVHSTKPAITCTHNNSKKMNDGFLARSNKQVQWEIDTTTNCGEGTTTASMKLTVAGAKAGNPAGLCHYYINEEGEEGKGAWLKSTLQFIKDKKYKCQAWLKGEKDGQKVKIYAGAHGNKEFELTTKWQKFEFDLLEKQGSEFFKNGPYPNLFIGSEENGTFWVDNMLIYQTDVPKFALLPYASDALKEYKPQYVRVWSGYTYRTIAAALSNDFGGIGTFENRYNANNGLTMTKGLEICRKVGGNPWLPIWALNSKEELTFFMEFLGGDETTEGGKLRISQGNPKPWLEEFDKIIIECNNEAWNGPFNIAGSNNDPVLYGKLCNRFFRTLKSSPFYNKDKIVLVQNGDVNRTYRQKHFKTKKWLPGEEGKVWTFQGLSICKEADATDLGVYYGGADGLTVLGENDKELYQNQILYNRRVAGPNIFDSALELRKELAQEGRKIGLCIYEGGPGYPIPGPGKTHTQEGEIMGKSIAMGVLTLDAFMRQQEDGYFAMCYYLFKTGINWASHKDMNDMIPYPSWTSLLMRNKYCSGDLMKVDTVEVKTMDFEQDVVEKMNWNNTKKVKRVIEATQNVPWSVCYCYKDGNRYSYIVYNLSYDEPRKVKIDLPYEPKAEATKYILTHEDPRAHNRYEKQVEMTEEKVTDFSKSYTFDLPPCTIFVFVNEAK